MEFIMALTDTTVRQAKATGKAYTLGDRDGLSLAVSPQGGKSWHFRYYWGDRQKRMSLGTYPEVSLRQARQARDEARALLAKGVNPHTDRQQQRQAVRLSGEHTFEAVFHQWLARHALDIKTGKRSTHTNILRTFDRDVLPFLGKRPILDLRRPDLLEVIERIEQRGALSVSEHVRGHLNQIYRFALVKVPGLETNYAADLDVVAIPRPPARHHPYLRLEELPGLLQALQNYGGEYQTRLGLRLLLLTCVRTCELRLATPEQFDLERGLWTIPPGNVKQLQRRIRKMRKVEADIPPYLVPLSTQAMDVVRELLRLVGPSQRYLLRNRNDPERCISESALNGALKRMGYANRLTAHGMRASFSTAFNEIHYPDAWIEAQLSHVDPNRVRAAYNHAEHVEPRRRMMQDWADRMDLLEQGHIEEASRPLIVHLETVSGSRVVPEQPFAHAA
jgi:integrase